MGGIAIREKAFGTIESAAGEVQALDMSHRVWASGTFTTVGGDVSEAITLTGCLITDIAFVIVKSSVAGTTYVVQAAAAANQINVTLSADPLNTSYLYYIVLRAI